MNIEEDELFSPSSCVSDATIYYQFFEHIPYFSDLPKDVRTLLNIPRNPAVISNVEPGKYIHFNLEAKLVENLFNVLFVSTVKELVLDFNTDGCIYKGSEKPHDPNTSFEKFIANIIRIMSSGGITFNGNKIPIRLRSFIADAPARAFILNHHSHVSRQPCSKCKVSGVYTNGRIVFSGINHALRTDEDP
ncbi:uncharacterized protein LOC109862819, partial [Pseudomyrmex gracilis]|uniref:uncharacterized protein LOC109862819 n=1 Tax=Pseudomyrmex gracilis TaxID=219809 RepID=UPI0009957C15